jgi:hypothetical protein
MARRPESGELCFHYAGPQAAFPCPEWGTCPDWGTLVLKQLVNWRPPRLLARDCVASQAKESEGIQASSASRGPSVSGDSLHVRSSASDRNVRGTGRYAVDTWNSPVEARPREGDQRSESRGQQERLQSCAP